MIFFLSSRLLILVYKHILLSKWEIPWRWLLSLLSLSLSRFLLVRRLSWDCARLLWVPNINSVAYTHTHTQNGRHMGYVRLYWTKELMKNHILRDATTEPPSNQTESIFQQISTCFFFLVLLCWVVCWLVSTSYAFKLSHNFWMDSPERKTSWTFNKEFRTGACAIFLTFYWNLCRFW